MIAPRSKRWPRRALLAISLLAVVNEAEFRTIPARVQAAPDAHLVLIGYDDAAEPRSLADRGAIGGAYLTHRNVRGPSVA